MIVIVLPSRAPTQDVTLAFSEAARRVGRVIIEESTLPESQRTYKPLSGKGIGE